MPVKRAVLYLLPAHRRRCGASSPMYIALACLAGFYSILFLKFRIALRKAGSAAVSGAPYRAAR